MRTRQTTTLIASAAVALVISLTGATTAYGATGPAVGSTKAVSAALSLTAVDPALDPRLASSTDLELLLFMMTGAGPIADAHPELLEEFAIYAVSTPEEVAEVTPVAEAFLAEYPAFSETWAPAIRSSDPAVVRQGRVGFVGAFLEYATTV